MVMRVLKHIHLQAKEVKMKKSYIKPQIEINSISNSDIITLSVVTSGSRGVYSTKSWSNLNS